MLGTVAQSKFARKLTDCLPSPYRRVNPWNVLNGPNRKEVRLLPLNPSFFFEAGANDGLKQRNTHYREARRGLSGVLVEPTPDFASRCRRNRQRATVVSGALVPPDRDGQEVELANETPMNIVAGTRGSQHMDEDHVAAGEWVQGDDRRSITVAGRTLSSMVDDVRAPTIDFLNFDLEGYEEPALCGLDLSQHAPAWILVKTQDPDLIARTLGPGYELVEQMSPHDWLFRRGQGST